MIIRCQLTKPFPQNRHVLSWKYLSCIFPLRRGEVFSGNQKWVGMTIRKFTAPEFEGKYGKTMNTSNEPGTKTQPDTWNWNTAWFHNRILISMIYGIHPHITGTGFELAEVIRFDFRSGFVTHLKTNTTGWKTDHEWVDVSAIKIKGDS